VRGQFMGKHAKPRTSALSSPAVKRATAISLGTFVLSLGAASPAIATTTIPSPPPLPQPVGDLVKQVTDATGLPNPLAGSSTTTKKTHHHRSGSQQPSQPPPTSQPTTTKTSTHRTSSRPSTPAFAPSGYTLTTLHMLQETRTAGLAGRNPAMAGAQRTVRIVPVTHSRPLAALPGTPAEQDTMRILLIALATMVIGGLASGHIRAAQQQRAIAW